MSFHVDGHAELRRCPWSQITDADVLAVERWSRWRRLAVWPYTGGSSDQPADVLEAIEVCEETAQVMENERVAEQQKKQAQPATKPKKR